MRKFHQSLTPASKITMILYPALSLWVGLAYTFGDEARTNSPSFDYARELMSIQLWGLFFLFIAAMEIAAWFTQRLKLMVFGLICGLTFTLVWAAGFIMSALHTPDASLTAPAIWLFIAGGHWASLEGLKKDPR